VGRRPDRPRPAQTSTPDQHEVVATQTAGVDAVSGATFTSASYPESVQSAIEKLGFKAADGSHATLHVRQDGGHGGFQPGPRMVRP
jgi:hypothetical protein